MNGTNYAILADAVGAALKESHPDELFIGPGLWRVDQQYLRTLFNNGVLNYFDGVSVHPYRHDIPETVLTDYAAARELISEYSASSSAKPELLCGEWGYTTCSPRCVGGEMTTVDMQARFLARTRLVNVLAGIPLTIWYVL